mmetsp:Transcript_59070/g.129538  ORF Transcript_59070/g.129538 Transcript_59070/m.129538 type:complete len:96 (+) Transcript_59070:576-863(+)
MKSSGAIPSSTSLCRPSGGKFIAQMDGQAQDPLALLLAQPVALWVRKAQQNQTLARRWGQVLALLWALLWALLLDLLSDLLSDLLAHQTSERQRK